MRRALTIFNSLNKPATGGYVPSLIVSYGGAYSPITISIGEDGGSLTPVVVDVANIAQAWAWGVSFDWLSVENASLMGDDTCTIVVDPQPTGNQPARVGYVGFSSGVCASQVIIIQQDARTV